MNDVETIPSVDEKKTKVAQIGTNLSYGLMAAGVVALTLASPQLIDMAATALNVAGPITQPTLTNLALVSGGAAAGAFGASATGLLSGIKALVETMSVGAKEGFEVIKENADALKKGLLRGAGIASLGAVGAIGMVAGSTIDNPGVGTAVGIAGGVALVGAAIKWAKNTGFGTDNITER